MALEDGTARSSPVQNIGLLDVAMVVAQHWRLLLGLPALLAVLVGSLAFWGNREYESTAWIRLYGVTPMVFTSYDVLEPVLEKTPWVRAEVDGLDARLKALRARLGVEHLKSEGVFVVRALAHEPQQAQALLVAVFDAYQVWSKPKGDELKRVQDELTLNRAEVLRLDRAMDALTLRLSRGRPDKAASDLAEAYGLLAEQHTTKSQVVEALENRLLGLHSHAWVQRPTLPDAPAPSGAAKQALAVFAVSFLVLLGVLMGRHSLVILEDDPVARLKLERIRQAFALSLFKKT